MVSANDLRQNVARLIDEHALITPDSVVVLGLSGGPDSVCLFHLLNDLRHKRGFDFVCAHVNHGLRAEDSDLDEEYVRKLCNEQDLPLEVMVLHPGELEKNKGVTVEEAARSVRYVFFENVCRKYASSTGKVPVIAVAHNEEDNAETVMMRILRGTGTDGLAGIPLVRKSERGINIVRPLLKTGRHSIEQYLCEIGAAPRIDLTNLETVYGRNKVRLTIIPGLDEGLDYVPGTATKRLSRLASNASSDKDYFDKLTDELIQKHVLFEGDLASGERFARVDFAFISALHPAVRHRLIVKVFSLVGLIQDIEMVHIEAMDRLLKIGELAEPVTGKSLSLPHGFVFAISYEDVLFLQSTPEGNSPDLEVRMSDIDSMGGKDTLEHPGFSFRLVRIGGQGNPYPKDCDRVAGLKDGKDVLLIDFDKLQKGNDAIFIRSRRAGDRIAPTGMSGTKKIQDLFVDLKIGRCERDSILLICTRTEVLWIPKLRKSRSFEVTQDTTAVLAISLV